MQLNSNNCENILEFQLTSQYEWQMGKTRVILRHVSNTRDNKVIPYFIHTVKTYLEYCDQLQFPVLRGTLTNHLLIQKKMRVLGILILRRETEAAEFVIAVFMYGKVCHVEEGLN